MKKANKAEIEKRLSTAVSHAVPDVKDSILQKCKEADVNYVPISFASASKKRKKYQAAVFSRIAIAAIAILLLLNIGVVGIKGSMEKQVVTTIDIDVNPSIELKINKYDKVVKVLAINEDAKKIVDGIELEGAQTNVALNSILGSMLSHGYLADNTRTILVSVDSKKQEKATEVQETVTKEIGGMLDSYSVQATVVSQTMINEDTNVTNLADEYGISQGKAAFVQKIVEADESFDPAELSSMSVTELDDIWVEVGTDETVVQIVSSGITTDNNDYSEAFANNNQELDEDANSDEMAYNDSDKDSAEDAISEDDSLFAENEKSDDDIVADDDDIENSISDNNVSENAVSANSVSDNGVSDNSISDNSVSNNSIEDDSVSNNSVSSNSVSSNSVSRNSVSSNSVSKNSVSSNSVSKNSVSNNSVSKNSATAVSSNKVTKKK